MITDEKIAELRLPLRLPVLYKAFLAYPPAIKSATTHDICDSGICLVTDTLLEKGTAFQVMIPHILDRPKMCTVVWGSEESDNRCKIGARFLEES